ncbi:MAG: YdcF family protein [Candidatus Saccharimonadales bacterium]
MRKSNTQLPTAQELFDILALESPRKAVKFDFLDNNQWLFDTYREVAGGAAWTRTWRDMSLDELVRHCHTTTDSLAEKVLDGQLSRSQLDRLYRHLCNGRITTGIRGAQRADAAFVFGSPSDARVKLAIECYFRNATQKLILSGKGPHYRDHDETEADRMKQVAIAAGVPERAIMVESQSVTLPDNVKRTLDLFDEMDWHPRDLIVIATTVVTARAYMEWYKFTPWDIEIHMMSPKPTDPDLTENGWFRMERGVRIVLNEYAKIVIEHTMDMIRQDENA